MLIIGLLKMVEYIKSLRLQINYKLGQYKSAFSRPDIIEIYLSGLSGKESKTGGINGGFCVEVKIILKFYEMTSIISSSNCRTIFIMTIAKFKKNYASITEKLMSYGYTSYKTVKSVLLQFRKGSRNKNQI